MNIEERLKFLNMVALENITTKNPNDKFLIRDSEGYMYKLSFRNLDAAIKREGVLRKFFGCNPFTFENINNYFKINNMCFELLDPNIKSATSDVEFKCLKHNITFLRSWNKLSNGGSCPECSKNKQLSYSDICKLFKSKGCEFLSKTYDGIHKGYKMRCKCGKIIDKRVDVFIHQKSYYCLECIGKRDNNIESIRKELKDSDIILHSKSYKNNQGKLDIEYICGFKVSRDIENIRKSKYSCPHCNKKGYCRDTEILRKEISDLTDREYCLLSEYKGMNRKVKIKHLSCGEVYDVTPHNFIDAKTRCPICKTSKGEFQIKKLLDFENIKYEQQFEFSDLRSNKGVKLKFDFALFSENNSLSCLIEYDGIFHYKKVHEYHDLEGQKERDSLKNLYCDKNKIKLYRIPYWEQDNLSDKIKEILIKEGLNGK